MKICKYHHYDYIEKDVNPIYLASFTVSK